ncbi:MAG: hypothetical protein WBN22_02100 [Verrucomicrobiia bacterium]
MYQFESSRQRRTMALKPFSASAKIHQNFRPIASIQGMAEVILKWFPRPDDGKLKPSTTAARFGAVGRMPKGQ